tara:strand:- start:524 stop:823 length:300 start_codon:yes stop_codon:yes gene_type:complete
MESEGDKLEKRLKMIIRQFSGDVKNVDGEMIPEVAIKGNSGVIYCFSPAKKKMIRVHRGTKAFILSPESELKNEKILIYTFDGKIVEINYDELIETGFD